MSLDDIALYKYQSLLMERYLQVWYTSQYFE